jgi:hypothetical protein
MTEAEILELLRCDEVLEPVPEEEPEEAPVPATTEVQT